MGLETKYIFDKAHGLRAGKLLSSSRKKWGKSNTSPKAILDQRWFSLKLQLAFVSKSLMGYVVFESVFVIFKTADLINPKEFFREVHL